MTDIIEYTKSPLPNVFTAGGSEDQLDEDMVVLVNRSLALGILSKFARTSKEEFKFVIDALGIMEMLPDFGKAAHLTFQVPQNHFQKVYDGEEDMLKDADHIFRSILVTSMMSASPLELFQAAKLINVNFLTKTDKETLPIVKTHLYTITIDMKPVLMSMDMAKVMQKYKNDD